MWSHKWVLTVYLRDLWKQEEDRIWVQKCGQSTRSGEDVTAQLCICKYMVGFLAFKCVFFNLVLTLAIPLVTRSRLGKSLVTTQTGTAYSQYQNSGKRGTQLVKVYQN